MRGLWACQDPELNIQRAELVPRTLPGARLKCIAFQCWAGRTCHSEGGAIPQVCPGRRCRLIGHGALQRELGEGSGHACSTLPQYYPTHPHTRPRTHPKVAFPARQADTSDTIFGRPPEPTSICVTCCLGFAFDPLTPPLPFPPSDTVSRPHPPTLPPTYLPICTPCSHRRQELRRSHQQQADPLHQLGAGAWVWGMGVAHQIP